MTDKHLYLPPEIWELIVKHFELREREESVKNVENNLNVVIVQMEQQIDNIANIIEKLKQYDSDAVNVIRDLNTMIDDEIDGK